MDMAVVAELQKIANGFSRFENKSDELVDNGPLSIRTREEKKGQSPFL
jgi:hypothetical protein